MNLEDKNVKALLELEVNLSLLNDSEYFGSVIHHLKKEYFSDVSQGVIFDTIKNHYQDFQEIPSLKDIIIQHKNSDQKTKDLVKTGIKELNTQTEQVNKDLLIKQTELFIKDAIFTKAIIKGADALGAHNQEMKMESFALAEESVKVSLDSDFGVFLEDIDQVFEEFKEKPGIKLNIPSFDNMIGQGYTPKTLHSAMAASGVGKSAAMTAFAVQFLLQKKDVVFVSLEMSEAEVSKRIYANLYDVNISSLPDMEKEVIKAQHNQIKDHIGQLVIKEFSAGGLTPLGLDGYLNKLQIEKNIKEPLVIIDYLGLMASDRMKNADNSYSYYGSIAEELRAIAQKRNLVMFTPLQLNRNAINNTEADQSSLSESMKILMTLDSAFIISQTPEMKDTGKMKINFVKNRMAGKTWSFDISFDYSKFRFIDNLNDSKPQGIKGIDTGIDAPWTPPG